MVPVPESTASTGMPGVVVVAVRLPVPAALVLVTVKGNEPTPPVVTLAMSSSPAGGDGGT